jgi:hypothetical protein
MWTGDFLLNGFIQRISKKSKRHTRCCNNSAKLLAAVHCQRRQPPTLMAAPMHYDMRVCTCRSFEALRKEFAQEGSVQLQKFLCPERSQCLSAALAARDNAEFSADKWPAIRPKPKYTDGLSSNLTAEGEEVTIDGWSVVGPAHMQRYLRFGLSDDVAPASGSDQNVEERPCAAGKELATIKDVLFGSVSFARLMYAMTGLRPVGMTAEARRFRPGLDYTVAHHGLLEKEARLDATLSFVVGGGDGGTNEVNAALKKRSGRLC